LIKTAGGKIGIKDKSKKINVKRRREDGGTER